MRHCQNLTQQSWERHTKAPTQGEKFEESGRYTTSNSKATTFLWFCLPYILIQAKTGEIWFINIVDISLVNTMEVITLKIQRRLRVIVYLPRQCKKLDT